MSLSILAIICGYLLGSIPSGYFIARAVAGVDPRRVGDGNVGSRNVYRTAGPAAGLATFFADIGNGLFYGLSRLLAWGPGQLERATFEFGTAYIAGAGLLNFLVALDAYDLGVGKRP